ncbi:MAG: lipoprotein [Bacteroidia bacterium]
MQKLFLLCLLFPFIAQAQPSAFFETVYGFDDPDFTRGIVQYSDSSLFVAGFTNHPVTGKTDIKLYKLSKNGTLIWVKTFGDSTRDENAQGLLITADENLLIWGEQENSFGNLEGLLMKTDTSGNLLAVVYSTGTLGNITYKSARELQNGNIAAAGFSTGTNNSNDFFVCLFNSSLVQIGQYFSGNAGNDYCQSIAALPDSGFAVAGDTYNQNNYDIWLARFDKNGNLIWSNTYGDTLQNGSQSLIYTSDGHLLLCGETEIAYLSPFNFFLQKFDLDGNALWRSTFGGSGADAAFSVCETWNGFIGTGYSNSYVPGPISVVVFRTDSAGNLLWAHEYGGNGIDIGYQIIPSFDNGYYITGNSDLSANTQCYLLHTDEAGWTSVNNQFTPEFCNVFPNPTSGEIHVVYPSMHKIEVFDMFGSVCLTEEFTEQDYKILMPDLKQGAYLVRIYSKDVCVTRKIILAR